MGGYGSGNHYFRRRTKTLTGDQHSINVNALNRAGCVQPGASLTQQWRQGNDQIAELAIEVEQTQATFNYTRHGQRNVPQITQAIGLIWTPCHLGGQRPWFLCPGEAGGVVCRRRVALLYAVGSGFLCRRCCNLVYPCQSENRDTRLLRRSQNIRQRLGAQGLPFGSLPPKPRGMHWRTHGRLWEEAQVFEHKWIERMQEARRSEASP